MWRKSRPSEGFHADGTLARSGARMDGNRTSVQPVRQHPPRVGAENDVLAMRASNSGELGEFVGRFTDTVCGCALEPKASGNRVVLPG